MNKLEGQFTTKDNSLQEVALDETDELKTPKIKNLKSSKNPLANSKTKTNITRAANQ